VPDLYPKPGFMVLASRYLEEYNSLCSRAIHPSRLTVLPKMHTPQNGLTERSLSLYLSLFVPAEVVPRWIRTPFIQGTALSLLLVPWPYQTLARQFKDLSALTYEDLARPDPVASLVRAVGPNLLIALLMDGPQIRERWASRFATVFADDPGCSVLSLTSIGMSQLSRPRGGPDRSRVVAIWKDSFGGATEIELPPGSAAVAISLSIRYREEYTADGRGDGEVAAFPALSGVHPIQLP
jgi:hypothetical protein